MDPRTDVPYTNFRVRRVFPEFWKVRALVYVLGKFAIHVNLLYRGLLRALVHFICKFTTQRTFDELMCLQGTHFFFREF